MPETCTFLYDTGGVCQSFAAKNHRYCAAHLRHRASLMRIARARARNEPFQLTLPPLESMPSVQSALSQLAQAVAADMIDLHRTDRLIRLLSLASRNLLKADEWPTGSAFQAADTDEVDELTETEKPVEIDVAAEYDLPSDLDLARRPEDVFPPPPDALSSRAEGAPAPGVEGSAFSSHWPPATDHCPPELPLSGNYCGDHHSRECECNRIRADYPFSAETVEMYETSRELGPDAAAARYKQLQRNRGRRQLIRDRKRYEAIAVEKNMRRAAEILAERKLADRAKQETGCPTPPSVGGTDPASDGQRKPATSTTTTLQTIEKSTLTPTG
jgi:hypothetical protein